MQTMMMFILYLIPVLVSDTSVGWVRFLKEKVCPRQTAQNL